MKKKVLTSLVLSAVIAAAAMPMSVFAAQPPHTTNNKTVVGYTTGGSVVDPEGKIMVEVPKDITIKAKNQEVNYDLTVKVWNADLGDWEAPGTIKLGKDVTVKVKSKNGDTTDAGVSGDDFTLKKDGETVMGKYELKKGDLVFNTDNPTGLKGSNPGTNANGILGVFSDSTGKDDYAINAKLKLTEEPKVGQNQVGFKFTDTLKFTFEVPVSES